MKKRTVILFVLLAFILFQNPSYASTYSHHGPVYVFIDGKEPVFTNDPIIRSGTTLVEFRPVFEMLGLTVAWDAKERSVTGKKEDLQVKLKIGSKTAYVNGKKVTLSQAPEINSGRTIVPLRFVAEASGKTVQWDGKTRMIIINNDGTFEHADFSFGSKNLNAQLRENAVNGILGPFHASQQGASLAEMVNQYGFPDVRHDGTPNSGDLPFVIYGDYLIYYLGIPGDDYLHDPHVVRIHAMLPNVTTNQDIIHIFGDDYLFEDGLYLNMIYDLGEFTVFVETEGKNSRHHPYFLSIGNEEFIKAVN